MKIKLEIDVPNQDKLTHSGVADILDDIRIDLENNDDLWFWDTGSWSWSLSYDQA